MKLTRRNLAEIVAKEVRARLYELRNGNEEDDEPKAKGGDPKKPSVQDAEQGQPPLQPADKAPDSPIPDAAIDGDAEDDEEEAEEEEDDALDDEGDASEEPSGAVNDEISGKTVQAITIEPKSKVLPGSKEVILAFNESTDTLRILVTSTGQVKFFWRGQLHDIP